MRMYLAIGLAVLPAGCGSKTLKTDTAKLSFLFIFDNSYRTLVRCAVDGDSIKCDENSRSPIPTLGSFQVYSGIDEWEAFKLLQGADGCFEGKPDSTVASLDRLNQLEDIGSTSSCRPVIRLASSSGTIEKEWGLGTSGRPQTAYFSGHLEPMQIYQLQVRNTEGEECKLPIRLKNEHAYSDAAINEVQFDFGSGFSLHFDTSIHSQGATIHKGKPFVYHWAPALDTAPLIAAGMDDSAVMDLLNRNTLDFIVLKASDPYGHNITCKVPDAPLGSIEIPGELMGRLERSAGFRLTRYKFLRQSISETSELIWLATIGEYVDRTDIGAVSGGLIVKLTE